MRNHETILLVLLIVPFIISRNTEFVRVTHAAKRTVHIPDELDDVVDDEEDDAWKQWGKKSTPPQESGIRPSDLSEMSVTEIQAEMMKRQSGPTMGFVKLRLGVRRSRVMKLLGSWSNWCLNVNWVRHFMNNYFWVLVSVTRSISILFDNIKEQRF